MKKIIRLTESDLRQMVGRVIKETNDHNKLYMDILRGIRKNIYSSSPNQTIMNAINGNEKAVGYMSNFLAQKMDADPKMISFILHEMLPQLKREMNISDEIGFKVPDYYR